MMVKSKEEILIEEFKNIDNYWMDTEGNLNCRQFCIGKFDCDTYEDLQDCKDDNEVE